MRAEIPIYVLLSESTAINALVAGRIFPSVVPQAEKGDAIVYALGAKTSFDSKTSYNTYCKQDVQVSVFCKNYNVASNLIETIRSVLERKSGMFGSAVTVNLDNIFFKSSEDVGYLDEIKKYHKVIEFTVFMKQ